MLLAGSRLHLENTDSKLRSSRSSLGGTSEGRSVPALLKGNMLIQLKMSLKCVCVCVCVCVRVCVESILGEFQRGDPVTDPQLRGSVRISPPSCTSAHKHARTQKQTNNKRTSLPSDSTQMRDRILRFSTTFLVTCAQISK